MSAWRTRSSAAAASLPQRPPPAAGFTMAKKREFTTSVLRSRHLARESQRQDRLAAECFPNLLGQFSALDLQRSGPREIGAPDQISADAFVIQQPPVTFREGC